MTFLGLPSGRQYLVGGRDLPLHNASLPPIALTSHINAVHGGGEPVSNCPACQEILSKISLDRSHSKE